MLSCLQAFHFLKTDMEKVFEKISSRSITNASFTKINDDDSFVNVVYSQYDLHQQKKCTYSMNYSTCKKKPTCTLPMESNVHIIPSPSGKVSLHKSQITSMSFSFSSRCISIDVSNGT